MTTLDNRDSNDDDSSSDTSSFVDPFNVDMIGVVFDEDDDDDKIMDMPMPTTTPTPTETPMPTPTPTPTPTMTTRHPSSMKNLSLQIENIKVVVSESQIVKESILSTIPKVSREIQTLEHAILFQDQEYLDQILMDSNTSHLSTRTQMWLRWIRNGQYQDICHQVSMPTPYLGMSPECLQQQLDLFCHTFCHSKQTKSDQENNDNQTNMSESESLPTEGDIPTNEDIDERYLQLQLLAIAAYSLFLQVNYTGPSLEFHYNEVRQNDQSNTSKLDNITTQTGESKTIDSNHQDNFHPIILAALAIDGDWPCHVCQLPYYLLMGRTFFRYIVQSTVPKSTGMDGTPLCFPAAHVWYARATVAHARLFLNDEPSTTLWIELRKEFRRILIHYCSSIHPYSNTLYGMTSELPQITISNMDVYIKQQQAATLILEWGLTQHHMNRPGRGRISFYQAALYSGIQLELTGALGRRTKYQQKPTAQLQVRASSIRLPTPQNPKDIAAGNSNHVKKSTTSIEPSIAKKHSDDTILLESVKYEVNESEASSNLSLLDQSIILAMCLDVKNKNPNNEVLTAEEMGAYLSRVLQFGNTSTIYDNDEPRNVDWMVYATALLERAWLEFESSHSKERSILQLQALNDQHSNRLTLTQSTFASIEEDSAPPQERLRHLHQLVYPPRWYIIRDLAERYAKLGIVTSAAELFLEIELWDDVVACYRRAGKERLAQEIVERRLEVDPTRPRMWVAMGDLTKDPTHYHKAIECSKGRFSAAYVALGQYHWEQAEWMESAQNYRKALALRPLEPQVWFRLGTIAMQIEDWSTALEAFSNVVQQEPEEFDAWANVAAIHMRNKCPDEAYPALKESLKYNRTNWRVWTSYLYTCLDLSKCDEAIQACDVLLDLQQSQSKVPNLEERCIKALVSNALNLDRHENSTKRTLSRLHSLLDRISSKAEAAESWIWETLAYFHEQIGWDEEVLENLLKEYRALQAVPSWERDDHQVSKVVAVVCQISHFYMTEFQTSGNQPSLVKCRYLVRGVVQKIKALHNLDESKIPQAEVARLEAILEKVQELMS